MQQFTKEECLKFVVFLLGKYENHTSEELRSNAHIVANAEFDEWNTLRKLPEIVQLEKEKIQGKISRRTARKAKRAIEKYQKQRAAQLSAKLAEQTKKANGAQ